MLSFRWSPNFEVGAYDGCDSPHDVGRKASLVSLCIIAARRLFSIHGVSDSIVEEQEYKEGETVIGINSSSVQVERIRLFLNAFGQISGVSPSGNHVIRRRVANKAVRAEVDAAPGRLLCTTALIDVGEQHTNTTLQTTKAQPMNNGMWRRGVSVPGRIFRCRWRSTATRWKHCGGCHDWRE